MYDINNVFAKIINGEISSEKLYEDELVIAINDRFPKATIHILVIPKKSYIDFSDFIQNASSIDIANYFRTVEAIARKYTSEYRIVSNKGTSAGQSVFHFHTHILSGSKDNQLIDKNL